MKRLLCSILLAAAALAGAPASRAGHFALRQEFTSSDVAQQDFFGFSGGMDGDVAIVGGLDHRNSNVSRGAAYLYRRTGGALNEVAKVISPNTGYSFGFSSAISGTTAIVGAPEDSTFGYRSGAAYIFEEDAAGAWLPTATLQPRSGGGEVQFGRSVSIDGNIAVVGAWGDYRPGNNVGTAYIFERQPSGAWNEVARLEPNDLSLYANFGLTVAVSGGAAVVGAWGDDDRGEVSGSAYVYRQTPSGAWDFEAKLFGDDIGAGSYFGDSVAIDGDTIVVGAKVHTTTAHESGAAYVFRRDGLGAWNQAARLTGDPLRAGDWFGWQVDVDGDLVAVSAPLTQTMDETYLAGEVYVFQEGPTETWSEIDRLALTGEAALQARFGGAISLSDGRLLVGAQTQGFVNGDYLYNAGAAYAYQLVPEPPSATFGLLAVGAAAAARRRR